MALAECVVRIDPSGRELVEHGTTAFPAACYHDDFRRTDVPWHWHTELEAALITEGSCVVAAGNEKHILRAGEGFFINSGVLHGCWDRDNTGCRFHSIVFHSRLVGGSLDSVFHHSYIEPLLAHPGLEMVVLRPAQPWQASALAAVERAWQHCAGGKAGYEFRARAELSELVFLLSSNLPNHPRAASARTLRDGERIKAMLSYIHSHYAAGITAGDIAASALISESECLRCFRATIGTTPIRYLRQYRVQQAARQLLSSDTKISEIAAACGFQDMSYFTKIFREQMGCVPTAYRNDTE